MCVVKCVYIYIYIHTFNWQPLKVVSLPLMKMAYTILFPCFETFMQSLSFLLFSTHSVHVGTQVRYRVEAIRYKLSDLLSSTAAKVAAW